MHLYINHSLCAYYVYIYMRVDSKHREYVRNQKSILSTLETRTLDDF